MAVLGTGLIGRMLVRELVRSSMATEVVAVDASAEALARAVAMATEEAEAPDQTGEETRTPPGLRGITTDLGNYEALTALLKDVDIALAALPDSLSFLANQAAVKAGCHMVDLVGAEFPDKRAALDVPARKAGVLIVSGCGVAPGIANVLAARGIELLDEADDVTIYCGGLPRHPRPPLMYQQVFSMEGLMGLYTRPVYIVEDGRLVQLPPMSGLEECHFPDPVGACEAAYSDAHSAPYTLGHRVKRLAEKTVRYRGHFRKMQVLQELGFLDDGPVTVDGQPMSPRKVTMALMEPRIQSPSKEDVTVMRVVAAGRKNGAAVRHQWTMMDFYDAETGYTSMARTTGFPALITAEWLAQGKLPERGFYAPEELLAGSRFEPFVAELARRGIKFEYTCEPAPSGSA